MRTLAIIATAAAIAAAPAAARAAQAIDLTIVAGHPTIFLWVKHLEETFMPAVDAELAKTGRYAIRWNAAFGGSLARLGGENDAVSAGLADVAYNPSLFNPSKLPLQNVSYVAPFGTDEPRLTTRIVEDLQRRIPAMGQAWERQNQVYIGGGVSIDSYHLFTTFPVRTLADLQGRRIGAPGSAVNWIKGTGAVPVAGDLTTYYNAIQTGVYDGVLMFATAAAPSSIAEVAPYMTRVDFGAPYAGGLTVNRDRWRSLPEEVRDALVAGAAAYADAFYAEQDARIDGAYAKIRADGGTVSELDPGERARWAAALPNVAREWAQAQDAAGLPGTEVLAGYMQALREAGETPPRDWDRE